MIAEAARYVHWGATSQDIIDTALVLELRAVIDDLATELDRAIPRFPTLAETPATRRPSAAPGCSRRCRCRSG